MTINFTTLFTGLGKIAGGLSEVNTYQGTTIPARQVSLVADLSESVSDGITTQSYGAQTAPGGWASYLNTLATNQVNTTVYADNPLLSTNSISQNLTELIRQMNANGQSVQSAAVSASVSATTVGNGVCVASTKDSNGYACEMLLPENVRVACTTDSSKGGTAGSETFTATGEAATTSGVLGWAWPGGSATSVSLTAVNASLTAGRGGQLLSNGDFENWTDSTPNGFTVTVGSVIKESTAYTGSYSLGILGDGSTSTSLQEQFGISTGTTSTLSPATQYAVCGWMKASSTPAAGAMQWDVINASNTELQDVSGTNCSIPIDLTTLTTSWVPFYGTFRTPYVLPSTYSFRIRITSPLQSGVTVYLDHLSVTPMTQLYQAGPSLAVFSGSSNFYIPDFFTVALTNGHSNNSFVRFFQRAFSLNTLGLRLPTAGSPTQADSLIS